MPEISRFLGSVIRMSYLDHAPPHFHALYGGDDALIGIKTPELLLGNVPSRVLELVLEWGKLHQSELLEDWRRLQAGEAPRRIAPLE